MYLLFIAEVFWKDFCIEDVLKSGDWFLRKVDIYSFFNVRYFEIITYEFILNYNKSVINLTDTVNILFEKTLDLFINY